MLIFHLYEMKDKSCGMPSSAGPRISAACLPALPVCSPARLRLDLYWPPVITSFSRLTAASNTSLSLRVILQLSSFAAFLFPRVLSTTALARENKCH